MRNSLLIVCNSNRYDCNLQRTFIVENNGKSYKVTNCTLDLGGNLKKRLGLRWKFMLHASLFLLLIASAGIMNVSAQVPYLSVEPVSVEISAIGESVNVTVVVHNVTDFYGCDFWLTYNDTLLQYTGYYHRGPGAVIGSLPDAALTLTDISVAGTVKVSILFKEAYVPRPDSFNGSGVVAWVEFEGLAEGVSPLSFVEMWTFLYNSAPGVITRDPCVPGEIIVIPEFPTATLVLLLLIVTLVAVLLGKKVWSKRRKDIISVK